MGKKLMADKREDNDEYPGMPPPTVVEAYALLGEIHDAVEAAKRECETFSPAYQRTEIARIMVGRLESRFYWAKGGRAERSIMRWREPVTVVELKDAILHVIADRFEGRRLDWPIIEQGFALVESEIGQAAAPKGGTISDNYNEGAIALTRDQFIEQFFATFQVDLSESSARSKGATIRLAWLFYQWIQSANRRIAIGALAFSKIIEPVIAETFSKAPQDERLDVKLLGGAIYDALDAKGIEVTAGPPAGRERAAR
jgi:hypothetical protein